MRNIMEEIENISSVKNKSSMMNHFQDEDLRCQLEDLKEKNARLEKQYLQGLMEVQQALLYAQESSADLKLQTQRVEQLESELKKNKCSSSSKLYSAQRTSYNDQSYENFKNQLSQSNNKSSAQSDWKVSLIQTQNQELRIQLRDLQKANQVLEDEKRAMFSTLQEKDDEMNLLRNKYENLEKLYENQSEKVDELFKEAESYLLQEQDQKEKALEELSRLQDEYQELQLAYDQAWKDKQMYLDGIHQKDNQIVQLQQQFNDNIYRLQAGHSNQDIYREFEEFKQKLIESDQQYQELQEQMNQCIQEHQEEQCGMKQEIEMLQEQLEEREQESAEVQRLLEEKEKSIASLREKVKEMNDDKISFMLGVNKELQELFRKSKDGERLSREIMQRTIENSSLSKKFSMDMCSVTYNLSSHDKHEYSIKKADPNKSLSTFQFTSECKGNFASASFRMKESEEKEKEGEVKPQLFNTDSFSSCSSCSSQRDKAFSDLLSRTQDGMYQTVGPSRGRKEREGEQKSEVLQRDASEKENLSYHCRISFNR